MAPSYSRLPVNDDILNLIFAFVRDGASLMRLRRVCRYMLFAVDDHGRRRFDVNKMLTPLFSDVIGFRQIQAEIGAVLSGSRVMNFFRECDWTDFSDLDVYLYPGTAAVLGNFLIAVEGYEYVGLSWTADLAAEPSRPGFSLYNMAYVRRVYKFEKGALKIDLVVATQCPLQTILHFHSMPVVNGITWDGAFSCFAYGTWAKDEGMILDAKTNPALAKYRARGFTLYDARVSLSHTFNDYWRTGQRWIGDRDTWTIKLDTTGLIAPAIADRLTNTSFRVVGVPVLSGTDCLKTTEYRVETICFTNALLSMPCTVSLKLYRFADAVINCVRRRWVSSGLPFSARVSIGTGAGFVELVRSWDRLLSLFWQLYKDFVAAFWTIEELLGVADVNDVDLPLVAAVNLLKLVSSTGSLQTDSVIADCCAAAEYKSFLGFQSAMERIHLEGAARVVAEAVSHAGGATGPRLPTPEDCDVKGAGGRLLFYYAVWCASSVVLETWQAGLPSPLHQGFEDFVRKIGTDVKRFVGFGAEACCTFLGSDVISSDAAEAILTRVYLRVAPEMGDVLGIQLDYNNECAKMVASLVEEAAYPKVIAERLERGELQLDLSVDF
ncbi:hypothetical protein AURDEDRAFT_176784 [Auricularia subglabra TFB-10046 SS5]|uniref:F-box domain-containing protein n=1 Tax=Auricularia subglabra (strain TFB-10046 / SS5) TaxID=717982 RepID=J0WQJ3_AURST|nr:hypothetical protein AURDEDRAFT_176784 [Auricularia subglabra TFB-10046 SS5]